MIKYHKNDNRQNSEEIIIKNLKLKQMATEPKKKWDWKKFLQIVRDVILAILAGETIATRV